MATKPTRGKGHGALNASRGTPPSPGEILETPYPLLVSHVRKWGGSIVLVLPKAVCESLGLVHHDLIGIRKVGRRFVLARLEAGRVMPLSIEEARNAAASPGD